MSTTAAADNGVGCNVTAAAEDIGWTWLGQGGLTAHYFAPYGRARPAKKPGCIAVSA
jgi:hypothetical protein